MKRRICILGLAVLLPVVCGAVPTVKAEGPKTTITGTSYRVTFTPGTGEMALELRGGPDQWRPATATREGLQFAVLTPQELLAANTARVTWALRETPEYVAVGRQLVLDLERGLKLQVECLCGDEGMLLGTRVLGPAEKLEGHLFAPPRLLLEPKDWDAYAFWGPDGRYHGGKLSALQPFPGYAGASAWGAQGDTVSALDPAHPALVVRSEVTGRGLGVVYSDYPAAWRGSASFLQCHTPSALFFYGGFAPPASPGLRWAWLAPFPEGDPTAQAARVERLVKQAEAWTAAYTPVAPAVPEAWLQPLPDFPADQRRAQPVSDINDAIVYTINEDTNTDYGVSLARKVGSDVLIRGWFKWGQRPPVEKWQGVVPQIHAQGALFGGGITCSALYDNENGLTREQVLDMATRAPDGSLVDAWDQPGTRHGSLSCPAYRDYLFRWCQEQIDAGADYLFMDEHNAALSGKEGYDDYSLRDFRQYLLEACPNTKGWTPTDPRWSTALGVPLTDPAVCPGGSMAGFDYRAFLRTKGFLSNWLSPENRLAPLFGMFRRYRDDRAWKALTDRIRAYAATKGRQVLISGNGLVPYVDLQVTGVWGNWKLHDGHLGLTENLVANWRAQVEQGQDIAGKRLPVVFFHDWGFGDPPFPWMAITPEEREVWMRTRGAEIYAAGGYFAFPVLGPFNCDAARDGTLPLIASLSAFYRRHRDLYQQGEWLGGETVQPPAEALSVAAWWLSGTHTLAIHAINRDYREGKLQPRANVTLRVPVAAKPTQATVVSPDFPGQQSARCLQAGDHLEVTLPRLDAYAVALLSFPGDMDLARLRDPAYARPTGGWWRPPTSEFRVLPGGRVAGAMDLTIYLQGMLHQEMRNPPTFTYNARGAAQLGIRVHAVATDGARLEVRVDGGAPQAVDLPDRDGKNDGNANEYNETLTFTLPAGKHRVAVDNVGGDWAALEWYQFTGDFKE